MIGLIAKNFIRANAIWFALGISAAVIAFGFYLHHKWYYQGYDARTAEYEQAEAQAKEDAREKLTEIEKGYDRVKIIYRDIPPGGCVGPAVRTTSDWLRKHHNPSE